MMMMMPWLAGWLAGWCCVYSWTDQKANKLEIVGKVRIDKATFSHEFP